MPKRAVMKTEVPSDILEELNARLVAGGFADYAGQTAWLNARLATVGLSVRVSKTSVFQHGSEFQKDFEQTMSEARGVYYVAKAGLANNQDQEGVVREATIRTMETRLLRIAVALKKAEENGDDPHLLIETYSKMSKALADLGRIDILSQKHKAEIRKQTALEAANTAANTAKDAGVSEETIKRIRLDVLGMAD